MRKINVFLIIILIIFGQLKTKAQVLSISETINYINDLLANNSDPLDSHNNGKRVWSISKDGKLSMIWYWYDKWSFTVSVYIKELNENDVLIDENGFAVNIQVGTMGDRNVVNTNSSDSNRNDSYFNIRFAKDTIVAKKLKNAIIHLIKISKQNKVYLKADPFDY